MGIPSLVQRLIDRHRCGACRLHLPEQLLDMPIQPANFCTTDGSNHPRKHGSNVYPERVVARSRRSGMTPATCKAHIYPMGYDVWINIRAKTLLPCKVQCARPRYFAGRPDSALTGCPAETFQQRPKRPGGPAFKPEAMRRSPTPAVHRRRRRHVLVDAGRGRAR